MEKSDLMGRIISWNEAAAFCREKHLDGQKIVFTNGVFDLLHRGHIEYLAEAKNLGDYLLVGVNDDESARLLGKGDGRPVNSEDDRLIVIAALESVDLVILFQQDTPLDLIELLQPDVLVKGSDYAEDDVVGGKEVKERGGEVVLVPLRTGYSSTQLLERIRSLHTGPAAVD